MHSNFLKYTWKGLTGYSYGYVLITNHYSIDDIVNSGKKIILWGWRPESYTAKTALEENGIVADYVCDVWEPGDSQGYGYNPPIRNYRELLKNAEEYYFIICLRNDYERNITISLIQYAGCDEFGIVYDDFMKDFWGKEKLRNAVFDSINEVFAPFDFLHDKANLANIAVASLTGTGYWDVPYRLIYDLYKRSYSKKETGVAEGSSVCDTRPRYFEVGPGIGIMSLSLKKLLDIDVTWAVIPNEEERWSELKRESTRQLMEKYHINTKEGFIETDVFAGGVYDVIVLAQVMEHFIFNPVNVFRKLAAMLAEDGYIFCSVPEETKHYNVTNYHEMPFPEDVSAEERERRTLINNFGHFHEYTYEEAMEVFEESGLECVFHKWTAPVHHFMLKRINSVGERGREK